jgi:nicotinamide-nucleotide adenylyltransferase
MKRGLFVGRFQPIHQGHVEALKRVLSEVDEIVIVIGSAQRSHDLRDPFTAGERLMMVRAALHEAAVNPVDYYLIPVPDAPMHAVWVAEIDSYAPPFDTVYSNDPLTCRLFKERNRPVKAVPLFDRATYSGTEVRRRILAGNEWRELVPSSVIRVIDEIHGVDRIRELALTDTPEGRA